MNQLTIIGNLTKDPETRTTPSGKSVCSFDLAVNDRKGNTTYFRVSAWEKLGEIWVFCEYFFRDGTDTVHPPFPLPGTGNRP